VALANLRKNAILGCEAADEAQAMAMLRTMVIAAIVTTLLASADVFAQTSCQPTIMQPCPPPPRPEKAPDPPKATGNKSSQSGESRRGLQVDPDTTLGLGRGGLGLQRRF
jgi:hypothetical protein